MAEHGADTHGDALGRFGRVEEVTPQKQQQLVSMGEEYASYCCPPDTPCRFDVVAIEMGEDGPRVTVYPHAFDA